MSRSRKRAAAAFLYWLVVLVVSAVLVFALLAWFEARDRSAVGTGAAVRPAQLL